MHEYRFVLPCRLKSPLALGSGQGSSLTDSELRRNSQNKLIIPGTSLAGVLRSAIERISGVDCKIAHRLESGSMPCDCDVCCLFGNVVPTTVKSGDIVAAASRVSVHDAELLNATTRIVDGVAIDRARRSAADARKYDHEEVLPGASFVIELHAVVPAAPSSLEICPAE